MLGIINLQTSNLMSITNSLEHLNIPYITVTEPSQFKTVNAIILPGVGSFGNGVSTLKKLNLFDALKEQVQIHQKPILGICLGMQLLFQKSEESIESEGLSLLAGTVEKLPDSKEYPIPRIGWAESVTVKNFLGFETNQNLDFYYIHSFYVKPTDTKVTSVITEKNITAAVQQGHIYGCQFHPEKSHLSGLNILKEFNKLIINKTV